MKRLVSSTIFGLCLVVLFSCVTTLMAQLNKGSIVGTVTDPKGGVMPGANVAITEEHTQTRHESKTDSAGYYIVPALSEGTYSISVTSPGFKEYTQSGVPLNAGAQVRADVVLQLGQVSEHVTVTGAPPVVETRDATLNDVVDKEALEQLPNLVNGGKRDITAFEQAIPGYQGGSGFQTVFNGSIGLYGEMLVDGAPAECNPAALGGCLRGEYSQEVVAEFKVADATDASAGFSAGSEVSMVSKSGTNTLHGGAYEYIRNNAFDSRCFYCSSVVKDQQDEYGFTLGGPIYIPKVYDGRNKSFFFFNLGRFDYLYSLSPSVYTMPTDAFKQGDFSSLLGTTAIGSDALQRPVYAGEIYNPSTTRQVSAGQVDPTTGLTAAASGTVRDPFPGNSVPSTLWVPQSKNWQSYWPEPQTSALVNNFIAAGGSGSSPEHSLSIKGDEYIGSRHRISVFYWMSTSVVTSPWPFAPIWAIRNQTITDSHPGRLTWTFTATPSVVNDMVLAEDRVIDWLTSSFASAVNTGATTIGVPNSLGTCAPRVNIGGYSSFGATSDLKCGQGEFDSNWRAIDNLTWQKGKHIWKIGGDWIRWHGNFPVTSIGEFTFNPGETGLPGSYLGQTGYSYASFLLGTVDSSSVQGGQYQAGRSYTWGLYLQDEYHASRNLTLNLGVRYDAQPMPVQGDNQISQWIQTKPNPGCGGCLGALGFAGYGPGRLGYTHMAPTVWGSRNFAPRVGFAYKWKNDTVVRGNWGVYWGPVTQQMAGFDAVLQQGFFPTFTKVSPDGYTPAFNWTNGFPLPYPAGSPQLSNDFDPAVANGSSTYYFGHDAARAPFIMMYHLSIQHQLPGKILFDLAYFGQNAHGIIALGPEERNQLNYQEYGSLQGVLADDINSPQAQAAGIKVPYPGFTGNVAQALRPFPQYLSIQNEGAAVSYSTYNSVQFKLQHQWSNGLSFLVGYTIAKDLSDVTTQTVGYFAAAYQDAYNGRAEKAVTNGDIPQQVIANYVYELPLGPGKRFLNQSNPLTRYVLGGWQLSGVHTYQSGNPVGLTTEHELPTMSTAAISYDYLRPDVVGGVPQKIGPCQANSTYLNIAAFADPGPWTFGNAPRTQPNIRSCHYFNENISLNKFFPIKEKAKLNIGADTFNLFNRVQAGGPNTDIDSATFGTITSAGSGRIIQLHARIDF